MYQRRLASVLLRKTPIALAVASAFLPVLPVIAAPGDAAGSEFRVNTFTADFQADPAIAMDGDGDFVVTWTSYSQDGQVGGIYAQRYHADGTTNGTEFRVNTTVTGHQMLPAAAMDSNGNFVVAWQSSGQDSPVGFGIYGQRYLADGTPAGGEFLVNTFTSNYQVHPAIAMNADGDFVVAWASLGQDGSNYGVYAQRYDNAGAAQGGEFLVNSVLTGIQDYPSVVMDAEGDFVIAWNSNGQDGSSYGIYAQRYNANGTSNGTEFRVNSFTSNNQSRPALAMDGDGDFIVVWGSYSQDGSRNGIYAQRYTAAGAPQGSEFQVNSYTSNNQYFPAVAMDAAGDFVVTWNSYGQDGSSYGVYAQRYTETGAVLGSESKVNTFTSAAQMAPAIGMDNDGAFVIGWHSSTQDGDGFGIFAQRYDETCPTGVFDFEKPAIGGTEASGTTAKVRFARTGSTTGTVTVHYATDDGTATAADGDYTPILDGTIIFGDGQNFKSVNLSNILNDTEHESVESFHLDLTFASPGGCVGTTQPTTDIRIGDNDPAPPPSDGTPNAFVFTDKTNVALHKLTVSDAVKITGTDLPAAISITGGEYLIAGSSWTTAPAMMPPNAVVKVRHTSASTPNTVTNTTLTIGGVSDTFTSTTSVAVADTTPDAFAFTDQTNVALHKLVVSNAVVIRGVDTPTAISISGSGEYLIAGGSWTTAPGMVNPNAVVKVRHTSASGPNTSVNTTLTIGGVSDTFTSTTAP